MPRMPPTVRHGWAPACLLLVCAACTSGASPRVLDLPERPPDAPGGAEVAEDIRTLGLEDREERIYAEIARGNVPTWLRRLRRVEVEGDVAGVTHRVAFWVAPDYLAVGDDDDFLLVPLSSRTALRVADLVGGSLPTRRMVDAIWKWADVRLAPIRIPPDSMMASVQYFQRHDRLVKAQRFLFDAPPGPLTAGHKVDLVLTAGATPASAVALYGWHRPDGRPVQPLFPPHSDTLVAFSHGVRLVDRRILVDGEVRDLWDVLRAAELAPLLGEAGVVETARAPLADEE